MAPWSAYASPLGVEVITFRSGVKPLDALGEWWFDKGAKGHTRR